MARKKVPLKLRSVDKLDLLNNTIMRPIARKATICLATFIATAEKPTPFFSTIVLLTVQQKDAIRAVISPINIYLSFNLKYLFTDLIYPLLNSTLFFNKLIHIYYIFFGPLRQ